MNRQEKTPSCWEKLYVGLIEELVNLPKEKVSTDTVRNYRSAIKYSYGRYRAQGEG